MEKVVRSYHYVLGTVTGSFVTFNLSQFCIVAEKIFGYTQEDLEIILNKINKITIENVEEFLFESPRNMDTIRIKSGNIVCE